ncbi:MAG: hypothetical protein AB8F78_17140 [Saprospiraceae bacterium]
MNELNEMVNMLDLSFYKEAPELSVKAELTIEALAPLSMVSSQPGTYFRSELAPTRHMVLGMLENALGWHFHGDLRRQLRKGLAKVAKKDAGRNTPYKDSAWLKGTLSSSGSKYESLLDHHVELSLKQAPETMGYDDFWSMHLHDKGGNFLGGSRAYDSAIEALITATKSSDEGIKVEFGDRKGFDRMTLSEALQKRGAKINVSAIREAFPQYYVSPKKRGYVIPKGLYVFDVATSSTLSKFLNKALLDPKAPLYIGSNDGWVDVKWESK